VQPQPRHPLPRCRCGRRGRRAPLASAWLVLRCWQPPPTPQAFISLDNPPQHPPRQDAVGDRLHGGAHPAARGRQGGGAALQQVPGCACVRVFGTRVCLTRGGVRACGGGGGGGRLRRRRCGGRRGCGWRSRLGCRAPRHACMRANHVCVAYTVCQCVSARGGQLRVRVV
jgi:hypothetical protein